MIALACSTLANSFAEINAESHHNEPYNDYYGVSNKNAYIGTKTLDRVTIQTVVIQSVGRVTAAHKASFSVFTRFITPIISSLTLIKIYRYKKMFCGYPRGSIC